MASSSPPVVKGQEAVVISEICSFSWQKQGHEMQEQETFYQAQNWPERVDLCLVLRKIMQDSCKTKRIVGLKQYSLSSQHFMSTKGRRWTVLATSLAQSHTVVAGVEGQPAPPCFLRVFLISCPQGIPVAAAAQKPPAHTIFITAKGKFPWRFVLGAVPLVDSTPLFQHMVLLLLLYSTCVDSGCIWSLSVPLILYFWSYLLFFFLLVEIFNFHQ